MEGTVVSRSFPNKGIVLCESDEQAVVKDVLPGQRISFIVTKKRHGKAEGRCLEILEQAENETPSSCTHYPGCGGCSYRTLEYSEQVKLKTEQVKKLLEPALLRQSSRPVWDDTVLSPESDGYRNKMEFSFGDGCKDGPLELGLHKKGSFYDILTVTECQIVDDDFRQILKLSHDFFTEKKVPFLHRMSHEGILRHLLVRKAKKTGEILAALVTTSGMRGVIAAQNQEIDRVINQQRNNPGDGEPVDEKTQAENDVQALAQEWKQYILENGHFNGTIAGLLHITNDTLSDVIKADSVEVLYGRDYINEELLGLKFKISVFSFFQTNSLGAEKLYETARSFIGDIGMGPDGRPDKTVFDLYSGTGTIAQLMAPVAKKVIGVEIVEEAVEAARENARDNGIDNCSFIAGDVLKVIDDIEEKPDFLILDPPRDGIHPKALPKLIAYDVPRILYVSCKPTSLARDLEVFIDSGYEAERIACVDMFPFTNGIETVCLLSKLHEAKHHVNVKLDMDELDLTSAEAKATYKEIEEWVQEHYGFHVTNLNIAQVKQKHGIIERENYNKPKSENSRQPGCPEEKVTAIEDALRHFQMI